MKGRSRKDQSPASLLPKGDAYTIQHNGQAKAPQVSLLIVNYNVRSDLGPLLESIARQETPPAEVILVDNASTDGSLDFVKQYFPWVRTVASDTNLGFAGGNNLAMPIVRGRVTALLNPDTVLRNDALSAMVRFLDARPDAGICGGRLYNGDGSPGVSYGIFPSAGHVLFRVLVPRRFVPKRWRPLSVS